MRDDGLFSLDSQQTRFHNHAPLHGRRAFPAMLETRAAVDGD